MRKTMFWVDLVLIIVCGAFVANSATETIPIDFLTKYWGGLKKEIWAIIGSGTLGAIFLAIGIPAIEKK